METTQESSNTGSGAKRGLNITILLLLCVGLIGAGAFGIYERMQKNKYKEELKIQTGDLQSKNAKTFSTIENNLAELNAREGILAPPLGKETSGTYEDRIARSINALETVMKKNHEMIDNLRAQVGAKDTRIQRFEKQMAKISKRLNEFKSKNESLTVQIESLQKDLDMANQMRSSISDELALRKKELEEKSAAVEKQSADLAAKEKELHTAYYTVGTYKELKENNVVEKEGGIIGLGSATALKKDFDRKHFNQIDILNYTSIPVFSKSVQIITNHNTNSYEIVRGANGEVQWLKITDPQKFWENSKYLVVIKKGPTAAATASIY
ncbi:MAG: hypothetical protein HY063_06170 [Bacteroidetes bacterium]|nr:hypothetical protein [Bacteroidota bacterium]